MSEWRKKKAEELGMLFEGQTLHRSGRILTAEKALEEAEEHGRRMENDAWCKSVCEMCRGEVSMLKRDDRGVFYHIPEHKTCAANGIRKRMEGKQ